MTTPATPPGWYPDPSNPATQRYWDGSAWRTPDNSPPRTGGSNESREWAVGIGSIVLAIVGLVMTQQSVTLFSGTGQVWTGVAVAAAGTALAFIMGARKGFRIAAVVCVGLALVSAIAVEVQLNEKRSQISDLFNQ